MSRTIKLAPLLRKSTDGQEFVQVHASTTLECLGELGSQFPDVRRWLYDLGVLFLQRRTGLLGVV